MPIDLDHTCRLQLWNYIKNVHVVSISDSISDVYVAEASRLNFHDENIRGKARLTKYNRIDKTDIKKVFVSLFPPRREMGRVYLVSEMRSWRIETPWNYQSYFISKGKSAQLFEGGMSGYKNELRDVAQKKDRTLLPEIIEAAFAPIDEIVEKMFEKRHS